MTNCANKATYGVQAKKFVLNVLSKLNTTYGRIDHFPTQKGKQREMYKKLQLQALLDFE